MSLAHFWAVLTILICAGGTVLAGEPPRRSAAELMDVLMWNREPVGGPFRLTDQAGRERTDAEFRGRLLLVYFGFTYCPDICPADLQEIGLALDQLGRRADEVQPIFVTLDPKRDTPEHLAEYLQTFHPRIIGLTGSQAAIRAVAQAYKVYYEEVRRGPGADYTIDHSALIYLIDASGRYIGFLPPGSPSGRIAHVIKPLLRGGETDSP
jgi:cytochrome oxidase Cu insertion factor (SCO1/SenC/PrrC family)